MQSIQMQARAKINLTMDVLYRREDGYHQVDALMQSISLCDVLTLEKGAGLELSIEGSLPVEQDNLILRAARMLAEDAGIAPCARLHLVKRIPIAAGLGGGSADAAAVLLGLNQLWGLEHPMEHLLALGATLGADVPFCMLGGCRRATGIGTNLQAVHRVLPLYAVVVKPGQGLLTKDIFAGLRLDKDTRHPDTKGAVRAVERGDLRALIGCMGNVLESTAVPLRPAIFEAMRDMLAAGAQHARMSGSGPTVFGLFDGQEKAAEAAIRLQAKYAECFAVQGVDEGIKFI